MSYAPSFAIINAQELQRLNNEGASASVMSVYITLCAYAQKDDSCFPSLSTIKDWIQGSLTLSTISKALKWLRTNKFIEQKGRTSKERFKLTYRKVIKATSSLVKRAKEKTKKRMKDFVEKNNRGERVLFDNREENQRIKPYFKSRSRSQYKKNKIKSRKNTLGYGRFGGYDEEAQQGPISPAERVFQDWMIKNPSCKIETLTGADMAVIRDALTSDLEADKEWREIMSYSPQNRRIFDLILLQGKEDFPV